MALNLKNIPVEELVKKATKFVEENPVAVGVSAAVTVLTGLMLFRRAELRRDGKDYNSQIAGGMSLLNNTDHTLKKNEFADSIEDYENMFGGARKEIGKITTEDSIEIRKAKYATMVNHFYNLVTDFYEWGWCQVRFLTISFCMCLNPLTSFCNVAIRRASTSVLAFTTRPSWSPSSALSTTCALAWALLPA